MFLRPASLGSSELTDPPLIFRLFIKLLTLGNDFRYVVLIVSEHNPAKSSVSKKPHDLLKDTKN